MLKINEIYGPVIQGEGKSTGKKVMFVRTSHCNLHCIWCDTPYTWNWTGTPFLHPDKYDKDKEVHDIEVSDVIKKLLKLGASDVKAVVISGGEPLLQQRELVTLLFLLKEAGFWVEVETNGTIEPTARFIELIDQFNCSPKLANSTDPKCMRERANALNAIQKSGKATFKFVVSSHDDIAEILSYVETYKMNEVYLMPEGRTVDELNAHEQMARELCVRHSFTFCQRLHIIEFGNKRGV